MVDFGLEEELLQQIRNILKREHTICGAKIFGSRAMGTYRVNSDIDIALFGEVDQLVLGRVAAALDALPCPYLFDVKSYDEITYQPLRDHIDKYGRYLIEPDDGHLGNAE